MDIKEESNILILSPHPRLSVERPSRLYSKQLSTRKFLVINAGTQLLISSASENSLTTGPAVAPLYIINHHKASKYREVNVDVG